MAGLNIPGVTDKYNTSATVEKLMQIERIPLTREQNQLDEYKAQKDAWREINTSLTSLRDTTKSLYSFENPFNNKLTTSTDENAITAEATRSASLQSFKIDVIQPASSDRFLTNELPSDYKVPAGIFTYKVGEKQITINWKGGTLKNFSDAINKRGNGVINSMVIGATAGKKTLLIESLKTGKENKLIFENDAKFFAESSGMISPIKKESTSFGNTLAELKSLPDVRKSNTRMPELSLSRTKLDGDFIKLEPRSAFLTNIPDNIKNNSNYHITFEVRAIPVDDITPELNKKDNNPIIPDSGFAEFGGIVVNNAPSQTLVPVNTNPLPPVEPIKSSELIYAVMEDGTEKLIFTPNILKDNETSFDLDLSEYPGIKSIAIKNPNTAYKLEVSSFSTYDSAQSLGFKPNHPVSEANDAIIKYEGITITRPSNTIDDVIPEITLNVKDKTEKTATLEVKADTEASKDALIQFVGKYNQTVAKINILSQTKPEIIEELDYFTDEEKEKSHEQLGMFQTDFSLTSIKSNMQSILSAGYSFSDEATITMLSQIGIATNAAGFSGSYSQSKLRGYLEIDEKKLDSALEKNLDDIKTMFGYDSDGDLIIDSGIAYKLDKQISAYTQTGGILALKTSTLDSKIKSSEARIARLEEQMDDKEAELRSKYSQMEGSLNSLESQQSTIQNFVNQNSNNRK